MVRKLEMELLARKLLKHIINNEVRRITAVEIASLFNINYVSALKLKYYLAQQGGIDINNIDLEKAKQFLEVLEVK